VSFAEKACGLSDEQLGCDCADFTLFNKKLIFSAEPFILNKEFK